MFHLVRTVSLIKGHAQVCVNYKDEDVLRQECEEARRLGYNGKVAPLPLLLEWCIT